MAKLLLLLLLLLLLTNFSADQPTPVPSNSDPSGWKEDASTAQQIPSPASPNSASTTAVAPQSVARPAFQSLMQVARTALSVLIVYLYRVVLQFYVVVMYVDKRGPSITAANSRFFFFFLLIVPSVLSSTLHQHKLVRMGANRYIPFACSKCRRTVPQTENSYRCIQCDIGWCEGCIGHKHNPVYLPQPPPYYGFGYEHSNNLSVVALVAHCE
jgi:hypothetical protein